MNSRLLSLTTRAAKRSMTVRPSSDGWALASPFRVVCHGSLDNLEAWLDAAEQRDRDRPPPRSVGGKADA
ncbi:hypothetical protein [Nocardia asteroides]|uniref:hypothetical protein n=1 Tax=Nocardia asteroides TaxID=1824 RepID=UPI00364FC498